LFFDDWAHYWDLFRYAQIGCHEKQKLRAELNGWMKRTADPRDDELHEQQLCTGLFMHAAESPVPTPATAYALLAAGPEALMGELTASSAAAARARHLGRFRYGTAAPWRQNP